METETKIISDQLLILRKKLERLEFFINFYYSSIDKKSIVDVKNEFSTMEETCDRIIELVLLNTPLAR